MRRVEELQAAIGDCLAYHHAHPKPYPWTAWPDAILVNVT